MASTDNDAVLSKTFVVVVDNMLAAGCILVGIGCIVEAVDCILVEMQAQVQSVQHWEKLLFGNRK